MTDLKLGWSQNDCLTWQSWSKVLVLLGKSVPNDPIRSGGWGGVGIGGLYGDTLIRSFRGNASNHQRHIKLSSLPIASNSRIFVFSQDSPPVRGPSLMDILDLHQKSIDCECTAFTDLSLHLLASRHNERTFQTQIISPLEIFFFFFGWFQFLIQVLPFYHGWLYKKSNW